MAGDGGTLHRAIVGQIPNIIAMLQLDYPDTGFGGSIDQGFERLWTGVRDFKGGKVSDGVIAWNGGYFLIEVGRYNPDKWKDHPVLHWGFDHTLTLIEETHPDQRFVVDQIRQYLKDAAELQDAKNTQPARSA